MHTLKTIIMNSLLAEQEQEEKEKTSWWATDTEKDVFDL